MIVTLGFLLWLAFLLRIISEFRDFDGENRAAQAAREQRGTAA